MADTENEKKQEAAGEPASDVTSKETKAPGEKPKRRMSAAAKKRLRYGGVATAITCVVVAIVVLVNVLVGVLVKKYPLKLDLTENAMYEISQETIDYLQKLDQEVDFTVLMAESNFQTSGTYYKMVGEILERYTQYSDRIDLRYVDPNTNPDVVSAYQANYSGSLTQGDIVIANHSDPSKLRVVSIGNLFAYDQEKYYYYYYYGSYSLEDCITGFSGEQDLTAALMFVTDADPVTVGVLATANGQPLYNSQFHAASLNAYVQTLSRNGYDVQTIDLYSDSFDADSFDMLLLPAPVNDLTTSAVEHLSEFLYNDGNYGTNLIYIADFSQGDTPNLDEFLSTWGIAVNKEIAFEGDQKAAQQVTLSIGTAAVPVASIVDETYSTGLANTALPIAAPLCRTIDLLWDSQSGGITSTLLKTGDSVYLGKMGEKAEDADTTPVGEQTVMAVSTRRDNSYTSQSSILVMGGMLMTDANLLQDASFNNAQYLMSAVNVLSGKGSSLIISSKDLTQENLNLTTADVRSINIVIYLIPFIVVVIGVVVFVRRRNR
ncbi:MAG: GldG family protein [Oscillospiraceae bacterium]|nr:GldG family protein [Oscillospiraceae bacterium]